MKLNIAHPINGSNICTEISGNNERLLYGKILGDVFDAGIFNPEYAGWIVQLTGGSDKQGFPMDSNLNTDKRQRLLRKKGDIGYKPKKKGERKRKSIRGAVVTEETSVLCMKIINDAFADQKEGKITNEVKDIPGLTDRIVDATHWPKRFTKLKSMLFPDEDYVTVEMIKEKVKSVVEAGEKSNKKMPRLRITRIKSPRFDERLNKRMEDKKLRKERSDSIRAEFLKKYPNWKIAN